MYFAQMAIGKEKWEEFSANMYLLHQAVMELFINNPDPGRVLFRAEARGSGGIVLVQSLAKPEPTNLKLGLEPMGLPKYVSLAAAFQAGNLYKFRLLASPAMRPAKADPGCGRNRKGLYQQEDQLAWLARKGKLGGFSLTRHPQEEEWLGFDDEVPTVMLTPIGKLKGTKGTKDEGEITINAVRFDGILKVDDPKEFYKTIAGGIGPGKGFGMGMLSLKRI